MKFTNLLITTVRLEAFFFDILKASDKVWHDGIMFKLEQNGIPGSLLDFALAFLDIRKQRVLLLLLGPILQDVFPKF